MNDEEAQSLIYCIPRDMLMKSLHITEEDMKKQGSFSNFGLLIPQENGLAINIENDNKPQ